MITEVESVPPSLMALLHRLEHAHLRIAMLDMRDCNIIEGRERGWVRMGQEMINCTVCHMGDHAFTIAGEPTLNAWVMITEAGREALRAFKQKQSENALLEAARPALSGPL